jgi:two-component system, response regulator FlrC
MPRILIVDDEPALLALLARTFVKAGFDVRTATDAAKAMESCTTERFDAVLSDVDLPGVDGHCLVRWIAATFPAARTVLMSGLSGHCDDCPFADPCTLLRKPFAPHLAIAAISKNLRG